MRILTLTNSYPSGHSPTGAAYITNRLRSSRALGAEMDAYALVPTFAPLLRLLRSVRGKHAAADLALDSGSHGREYRAAVVRWGAADVTAGYRGRVPERAVKGAVTGVLTAVETSGLGYDVVHAHGMYTLPAGEVARRVAGRLSVPYVVSLHGSDVLQVMPRVAESYAETLAGAAGTIYVSSALRDRAIALGAPRTRAHVIPNGVDRGIFRPEPGERAHGPSPRLLFVGNLLPVKGADRLPELLAAARAIDPGTRLDIIGVGDLRTTMEREFHARGCADAVHFHGHVPQPEVAAAMRAADVLLVPSRSEGWGCVVTESYATGTPVVATAVGGVPEAILGTADLIEPGPGVATRMVARALEVAASPPSVQRMLAHVSERSWEAVAAAELAVLAAAAGAR